jgi:hypothetical protein
VSELEIEPSSERGALARIALAASLAQGDVVGTAVGPNGVWVTEVESERLPGVVAAAQANGTYAIELHLIARPVPLHALAERIRERIRRSAEQIQLGDVLGSIDVSIEDIELVEEHP